MGENNNQEELEKVKKSPEREEFEIQF